ncbi:MAG: hypothetical protein QF714_00240 [Dehalococcoidia bacterium]|nr:hypothetical protein [Dehalococcoidia bacterium]
MLRGGRRVLLAVFLGLLVLAAGNGDYRPSALDLAVAPYRYSLVRWELSHFLEKWVNKLEDLLPWASTPSREDRIARAVEFFDLGETLRGLEHRLRFPESNAGSPSPEDQGRPLRAEIEEIRERRRHLREGVEETIEGEISAVLATEGFASRIGLIFPPVDTVFSGSPGALILSPRDRIERQLTVLLIPGLDDDVREQIEEQIFQGENMAALVASTGGVATYPSVVSDSGSLHHAVVTTAHEWLHHWFFFQPLGQHFWDSSQMTTLNETAATLGGRAIGDRAFTAMTGERINRDPPPEPVAFDFNAAMRETRVKTEELLAEGNIEEAEAYMEERRQFLAANGSFIRKINQAFFAFHGSYATSAASISPIDGQLRGLQSRSGTLEEFIKTVGRFGSYREFLGYLASGQLAGDQGSGTDRLSSGQGTPDEGKLLVHEGVSRTRASSSGQNFP